MHDAPVVLVTGCSNGGIGAALCEAFASRGCRVFASSRDPRKMDELARAGIETLTLDVTKDADVEHAVRHVLAEAGRIDVCVNNAGAACVGPMLDLPIDTVREHFNLNAFGALRVCQAVIPHMAGRTGSQRKGVIINIGSIVGEVPLLWHGAYSASKAALRVMTEVLDMECRPLNVHVMLVAPGGIRTNFVNNSVVTLVADSLYRRFLPAITRVDQYSQMGSPPMAQELAEAVVQRALSNRPPQYFSMGKHSTSSWLLSWLPRSLMLWIIWLNFSEVDSILSVLLCMI